MIKICKCCGKQYDGLPGSSACQDCVAERKKTTLRDRVCIECGRVFPGGPSAKWCPECRLERQRAAKRKLKRNGVERPIGSTDICVVCGAEYTVESGKQKYCKNCAAEAIAKKDRESARRWAADNTTPEQRREERSRSAAPILCAICGKPFIPHSRTVCCSDECRATLRKKQSSAWERGHRDDRNAYRRGRRNKRKKEG